MKVGKSYSINLATVFKKFYCHKCGTKLKNNPVKKLISPGDPDWKDHNRVGGSRLLPIGDIEVTEYNFKCPKCENVIEFDEQRILVQIQKKNGKHQLSDEIYKRDYAWAKNKVNNKIKASNIIAYGIFTIIAVAAFVALIITR